MMKHYQILQSNNPHDLAVMVQNALNSGWELAGGVAVTTTPYNLLVWAQALSKEVY